MIGKGDTSIDSSIRPGSKRSNKPRGETKNRPGAGRGFGYHKHAGGKRRSLKG